MRLDDGLDDAQPEPGRSTGPVACVVAAGEALEDLALEPLRHAGAVIGDGEHSPIGPVAQARRHRRAGGRVGTGVGEEVDEHLPQPPFVAGDLDRLVDVVVVVATTTRPN